ncbi:hypothetical protein JOB18_033086 [Solea senegalensis]|uniref:Uncharacterized protein n=1 Tax=Solea senegalensis TaxID=28829 RepID=A0AAV6P9Z6_SOLSE|nr:hypothetical protein JOB18_033086 [Solea senegalensis]
MKLYLDGVTLFEGLAVDVQDVKTKSDRRAQSEYVQSEVDHRLLQEEDGKCWCTPSPQENVVQRSGSAVDANSSKYSRESIWAVALCTQVYAECSSFNVFAEHAAVSDDGVPYTLSLTNVCILHGSTQTYGLTRISLHIVLCMIAYVANKTIIK